MSISHRLEPILLWIFVILAAIVIGGGLYELRVIIPLWAHAPPESVWEFAALRVTQPQYTPNAGVRFWLLVTPLHLLISFATLVTSWKTRPRHRRWVIFATVIFIVMHVAALVYFVPAINKLFDSRNLNMSPDEVVSRVQLWVKGTWLRFVTGLVGLLCGLRALQVKPVADEPASPTNDKELNQF
jgi:hypothetical protein